MGLDNIPKEYPCKTTGTAVQVIKTDLEGQAVLEDDGSTMLMIDCKATQECGGCPYTTELDKQDKEALGNPVYGIFGTDCWYRGKYGNYLLEAIGYDDSFSFFGDTDDGTFKTPQDCRELANVIDEELEECDEQEIIHRLGGEDITGDLRYASWYLNWAAEFCGGLTCWY